MLLKLDMASKVPIYMQIRNQIVLGIASGELAPGEKLPTIRALAEQSGVNMIHHFAVCGADNGFYAGCIKAVNQILFG